MTQQPARPTLTADIARAVADLPGVAFLKPDLTGRLRSALTRQGPGADTAPSPAGVRLTRPDGDAGAWHLDVRLVALRQARALDVARAVRRAAEEHLSAAFPAQAAGARVTVTVTGLV
ncbi:hypothetical protein [Streptomyces sp. NPDC050264]|uniref:hypothetical protein n=1 Tax=Streptomyces sp. NPDC050264 TaxID=3155038 RepID=UPI003436703D